jgi:hypothetical protein
MHLKGNKTGSLASERSKNSNKRHKRLHQRSASRTTSMPVDMHTSAPCMSACITCRGSNFNFVDLNLAWDILAAALESPLWPLWPALAALAFGSGRRLSVAVAARDMPQGGRMRCAADARNGRSAVETNTWTRRWTHAHARTHPYGRACSYRRPYGRTCTFNTHTHAHTSSNAK